MSRFVTAIILVLTSLFLASPGLAFVTSIRQSKTHLSTAKETMAATNVDSNLSPFIKCCIVTVQPDRADEFAQVCKEAQVKSMANEPGCLRLDILHIMENDVVVPNKFIVYEIFQDKAAHQYHKEQEYMQGVIQFVQSGGVAHEDAFVAKEVAMTV